jgi:hypothetical protein
MVKNDILMKKNPYLVFRLKFNNVQININFNQMFTNVDGLIPHVYHIVRFCLQYEMTYSNIMN